MKLTLHIDIWKWDIIPFYNKNVLNTKNKRTGRSKIHRSFGWLCITFILAA